MSDKDAKQFIERLKDDPDVRNALAKAVRDGAAGGATEYGAKLGLKFSGSELLKAYTSEMRSHGLSDEDLKDLASAGPHAMYVAKQDGSYATHPAYGPAAKKSKKFVPY